MSEDPEVTYYPPKHEAIASAKDQIQAEALDLVRKAHSVFLVTVDNDGDDPFVQSLAYGNPVLLPIAVQNEASVYLGQAIALIERELPQLLEDPPEDES